MDGARDDSNHHTHKTAPMHYALALVERNSDQRVNCMGAAPGIS
jgi:hypothetical protein